MKGLLIGLLALGSLQVFAGTIVSKNTGEYISLKVDREKMTLSFASNSANSQLPDGTYQLAPFKEKHPEYDTALMYLTDAHVEAQADGDYLEAYLPGPFFIIALPLALAINAIDVVILPFKGTGRLIKNANFRKDFKVLNQALSSNDSFEVTDKRFVRILGYFESLKLSSGEI